MERDEYSHYLNGLIPTEIAEHLKNILPDLADLNVEEVLLQQESAFQFIEKNRQQDHATFDFGEPSKRDMLFEPESESSYGVSMESQLALDEALARALELEDDFNDLHISERGGDSAGNTRSNLTETPVTDEGQSTRQDGIDPDRMTYEQLQELGDSLGHESKGLPEQIISRLPTSKYKVGLFSKKKEKEECVICCDGYKNGVKVTTLPCAHHYHSKCISQWLQSKKHCPVCQKEVQDK